MNSSHPGSPPTPGPVLTIPDHELLRPIGRGSYGEVWLARSALGEYRAVKIIRRKSFDCQRPVERELEGIQKFEPISRSHPNQVHILHVGQFPEGFYYVMELADDLNAEADRRKENSSLTPHACTLADRMREGRSEECLANYVPRTLRSEVQRCGRLAVAECVDLALKLTDALAHLHGYELVHRDVKPSNIIFVRNEPKLADIGLVASSDGALSCVGTEGFLPPEGPGKPQADVYALGKVLYEISTGRDRLEFPELPTLLRDDPQRRALEELNEVLLKACDPYLHRRYPTARAMHADLELLRAGKSLQQAHRRQRRWASARKAALGFVLVVGLLALLSLWWAPRREIHRILPVRPAIDEAAFWRAPFMPRQFDFSADGERIVFTGTNGITIWEQKTSVTRLLQPSGMGAWRIAGANGAIAMPRWAPDNRQFAFQAVKKLSSSDEAPLLVYALFLVNGDSGEARQIGPELAEVERANDLSWRPDGSAITCVFSTRRFMTVRLNGERSLWKDSRLPGTRGLRLGDYSADGKWLLVSTDIGAPDKEEDRDIWVVPHLGGASKRLTRGAGMNTCPTWGPRGDSVYFVSAAGRQRSETWGVWRVRIDPKTLLPNRPSTEVFSRQDQMLLHPKFVGGGRKLVYAVNDSRTRVWLGDSETMDRGAAIVRGLDPALAPDGKTVYFVGETHEQQGVFSMDRSSSKSLRKITELTPLATGFTRSGLSISPDGQWLALFGSDRKRSGVFLIPSGGGEPQIVEELPASDAVVPVWSRDGNRLAYTVGKQLVCTSRDRRVRQPVATLYRWCGWTLRWSPDGQHLAALATASPEEDPESAGIYVVAVANQTVRKLTANTEDKLKEGLEWHPSGEYLTYMYYGPGKRSAQIRRAYLDGRPTDLMFDQPDHWDYIGVWAPDGRRFFFTSSSQKEINSIHVYDAQTTQITHGVWGGGMNALPRWSSDGRTAVWAIGESLRYFEVLEDVD